MSEVSLVSSAVSASRVSERLRGRGGQEAKAEATLGQPRRRPVWMWGGALAMVLCAGAFSVLASTVGHRTDVLVMARNVPAGEQVTQADLRQVPVAAEAGVIPASAAGEVLGRTARVPLVKGALLARGQLGVKADYPPAHLVEAAVAVEAGKAPRRLAPGQRVAVVPGGGEESVGDEKKDKSGDDGVVGSVVGVKAPSAAGGPREITVLVDAEAARRLAEWEHPYVVVVAAKGGVSP